MLTPDDRAVLAEPGLGEDLRGRLRPVVVEAHPIDERPIGGETEQPRPRIPRLRERGDRPDLDVPEAEHPEAEHACASLSKPAATPNGEAKSRPSVRTPDPGGRLGRRAADARDRPPAELPDRGVRERVRALRVHARQHRAEEEAVHPASADPLRRLRPRARLEHGDRRLEVVERLEGLVDAREPQVGDLVELPQRPRIASPISFASIWLAPVARIVSSTFCASSASSVSLTGRPCAASAPRRRRCPG